MIEMITIAVFIATLFFIFIRPWGINIALPATIGAAFIIVIGVVSNSDLLTISSKVSGAGITIVATVVMAIVLESFGFFHWCASQLVDRSKGSGIRLFFYTNLLCFLMTLFFNNDGSILITTPILVLLLNHLTFTTKEKIPYLISGALVATASSAPIGVSNIVNLISLDIIDISLYRHTAMMLVPASIGLFFMVLLLYLVFLKQLPATFEAKKFEIKDQIPSRIFGGHSDNLDPKKIARFMKKVLLFVFTVRIGLYVASYVDFPVSVVAVIGSLALLGWRWYYLRVNPLDMLKKTPWSIFLFAFSMYVLVFGLSNIGLTDLVVQYLEPFAEGSLYQASVMNGLAVTLFSNLFNNHPALMIGTISLTAMTIEHSVMESMYLASIVGSDIGSLILPMGTLATLIWMHILKKKGIVVTWWQYIKVTLIVIPPTIMVTWTLLYFWLEWLFF
ncbi:arsenic transporter [Pseudalkalibacillus hwajinpoensis]|uniref:Arsenic transporter n=1 Tax=Guptibacillus hwajinpoensis TaxID=208199 RepID=A0A4U1MNI3_9BACL|nr:arsenic transporter [Pseudalkalibacillus hwajinpoensis]TKD72321.1 arsenic transporter [Pseudalkalibacillus hwajinpoensis]